MRSRVRSVSWRDAAVAAAIGGVTLLAWWALWLWGRSPAGHLLMHGPSHMWLATQSLWSFSLLFIGSWTLMTVAMMLPTCLPLILLFHRMIRGRATAAVLLSLVIAGYLAVWAGAGILIHLLNFALQRALILVRWPAAAPWLASAALLTIAGLYQFSSLKYACLDKCRSPLSFIVERWQGGNEPLQALRIGAGHGLFCVGCCWSLMLLMFVVGAGSLVWMLLLGAVMAVEKNMPWGRRLAAPLGVLLLVCATAMLVNAARS